MRSGRWHSATDRLNVETIGTNGSRCFSVQDDLNPLVTGMLMDPVDQHLKTFVHAQRIRIAARAPTIGRFPSAGLPQFIVVGLAQRSADADGLERPDDPAKLSASTLSLLIVP